MKLHFPTRALAGYRQEGSYDRGRTGLALRGRGLLARAGRAFTLLELLVVLAIIGILASIVLPTIHAFKPNPAAVATQQLVADLARARQLAISQRTTVYMIFLTTNFMGNFNPANWTAEEISKRDRLWNKQLIGYTFVALRRLGDQPGEATRRYLSSWRTLPEGTYFTPQKFIPRAQNFIIYTNDANTGNSYPLQITGFARTNALPFPSEETKAGAQLQPYPDLPYIAFNYLGQLTSGTDEYIPISQGSVLFTWDKQNERFTGAYQILENPPGNTTNMYNIVVIDSLTGRARVERQRVK